MCDSRVLVIDDDPGIRNLLVRMLRRDDREVDTADDGETGLGLIRRRAYDLVLLDYMMPKMNGMEVLARLQADVDLKSIPVLIVSALDEVGLVARCIEMGATDYLVKPFEPVILKARVVACLERKRLLDQEHEHLAVIQRELETGRQIQSDFLPESLPQVEGWALAVDFQPARTVAGDFYDAFVLGAHHLALAIADVCDKGVGAALFMALTRTLLRVFAHAAAGRRPTHGHRQETAPVTEEMRRTLQSVRLTNDYIMRHHNKAGMFASLFFAVIDTRSGVLAYVNAGHDAPLHVRRDGIIAALEKTGPAVGLMHESEYAIRAVQLQPEDLLCAYTDGLTEARDAAGEFFSGHRLQRDVTAWRAHPRATAEQLVARLRAAVDEFTAGAEPSDDLTMLCLQRRGRWDAPARFQADAGRSGAVEPVRA